MNVKSKINVMPQSFRQTADFMVHLIMRVLCKCHSFDIVYNWTYIFLYQNSPLLCLMLQDLLISVLRDYLFRDAKAALILIIV